VPFFTGAPYFIPILSKLKSPFYVMTILKADDPFVILRFSLYHGVQRLLYLQNEKCFVSWRLKIERWNTPLWITTRHFSIFM
jgi:hypothetical protein